MTALLLCHGKRYDRHAASLKKRGIQFSRFERGKAALEFLRLNEVDIFIARYPLVEDGFTMVFSQRAEAENNRNLRGIRFLDITEFTEHHAEVENDIEVGDKKVVVWASCSDETFNKALDILIGLTPQTTNES